jgi:hypothetical protein
MKYQYKFIKDWVTIYVTADQVGGRHAEGQRTENVYQFFPWSNLNDQYFAEKELKIYFFSFNQNNPMISIHTETFREDSNFWCEKNNKILLLQFGSICKVDQCKELSFNKCKCFRLADTDQYNSWKKGGGHASCHPLHQLGSECHWQCERAGSLELKLLSMAVTGLNKLNGTANAVNMSRLHWLDMLTDLVLCQLYKIHEACMWKQDFQ